MRTRQGEITVFLSLITVCCLSLFLGLLESARTTGARLYLEMAANSAMSSVMSQYNRNLWDMYHLLFLEAESEDAVKESFETFLSFYIEQENLYPMEMKETGVLDVSYMADQGGELLEEEILSYMKYFMPDTELDAGPLTEAVKEATKAGDFKQLFDVCLNAGAKTRKLEKSRKRLETCLNDMNEALKEAAEAAEEESEKRTVRELESLVDELHRFPGLVREYEKETEGISEYLEDLRSEADQTPDDASALSRLQQETEAFAQVEKAAKEQLGELKEMEKEIMFAEDEVDLILDDMNSEDDPEEEDWESIRDDLAGIQIPAVPETNPEQEEKALAIDRLEALFSGGLLSMVLPSGTEISSKRVSLSGIPSKRISGSDFDGAWNHFVVNEYCMLNFDTFLKERNLSCGREEQPFCYELEYLISGNDSDRKNLADTVQKLIFLRASMNLCYLSGTPHRMAEASKLAAAAAGGSIPVQVIVVFFVLTMWSMGEAILDARELLAGGTVPFWKDETTWKLSLEQLLSLEFLEKSISAAKSEEAEDYGDYLRVLCFLLDRKDRNGRILDLIQWNVRTKQADFAVDDCIAAIELEAEVKNRHLFFEKGEYLQVVHAAGDY